MKLCRKVSKKIIIIVANFTSLRVLVNRIDWIVVICKTRNFSFAQNSIESNSECIARQMIFTNSNIDNENILKFFHYFILLVRPFMKRSRNKRFVTVCHSKQQRFKTIYRFYRYIYHCGLTISTDDGISLSLGHECRPNVMSFMGPYIRCPGCRAKYQSVRDCGLNS